MLAHLRAREHAAPGVVEVHVAVAIEPREVDGPEVIERGRVGVGGMLAREPGFRL